MRKCAYRTASRKRLYELLFESICPLCGRHSPHQPDTQFNTYFGIKGVWEDDSDVVEGGIGGLCKLMCGGLMGIVGYGRC